MISLARTCLVGGLALSMSASLADAPAPAFEAATRAPASTVAEESLIEGSECYSCETDACESCGWSGSKEDWSKVPVIEPLQRPGNFAATNGPGYYTITDCFFGRCKEAPPKTPYPAFALMPPGFFNANYKLLEAPDYDRDVLEKLKRMHFGDDWMVSFGGELRYRYHSEVNSRLTGRDNDYLLYRSRAFTDVSYRDLVRIYAEFIDADNFGNNIAPLPFDENRADMLNLFGDFKVAEIAGKPVTIRGGRQELIYGSQRLISTLDWANNRREPFTGVKAFWHGEKWLVDAFAVQPNVFDRNDFDSIDEDRLFAGLWVHHNIKENQGADFYYLYLDDERRNAVGENGVVGTQDVNTFGTRYAGSEKNVLFDFEGMLQVGDYSNQDLLAGSATAGVGYKWMDCRWTPTVWVYYDWASGTNRAESNSKRNTFNQLFPFGHYYLGFVDLVGRQNIHDLNTHLTVFPAKWLQLGFQHHYLQLDKETDFLYNAGGVPIRRDPTGAAGSDVGHELDFIANFTVDKHQSVLLGYSILMRGGFLNATAPGEDPELTYMQYVFRW